MKPPVNDNILRDQLFEACAEAGHASTPAINTAASAEIPAILAGVDLDGARLLDHVSPATRRHW
jgi:hypothetical protein